MKLKLTLPSNVKDLSEAQRYVIVEKLSKALDIKPPTPAKDKEHNIWTLNDEPLLAEAEEDIYEALVTPALENMAELIAALGLTYEQVSINKAFSNEFIEYAAELEKAKGKHSKASDLWELAKQKRQDFLKYIQGGSNWTKKKLKQIEDILKQKLPDSAKIAEEAAVRAAFIAKIRNTTDTEALETLGAYVDRFPKTIEAAKHESVVLTAKQVPMPSAVVVTEAELDEALRESRENRAKRKQYEILPLQPQEVRTVENAEIRTAEKIIEVADRHRAAIKQIVLQAVNGRWTPQQLAQALLNAFGDQNRDWRRVAITELAMASNDAFLAGCQDGDQVWVPAVVGACKYCQKYLENKTFTITTDPKLMGHTYDQEMHYVWVGKTNYGRNVGAWVPCVPLHPNCRHRFHKLSRFYKLDEQGKPILKTTKELINEERARRGLPPDPNLK